MSGKRKQKAILDNNFNSTLEKFKNSLILELEKQKNSRKSTKNLSRERHLGKKHIEELLKQKNKLERKIEGLLEKYKMEPIKIYYPLLKSIGNFIELQINQHIQDFHKITNENHDLFTTTIKPLQNYVEVITQFLDKLTNTLDEDKQKQSKQNKKGQTPEFYAYLKKFGFLIEQQFNQHIQDLLNDENLIKLANDHADVLANNIRSLQKYSEVLSTLLHFPTKNDVANVAKLTLQIEEKVDMLEEHIIQLTNSIQSLVSRASKKGAVKNV